MDLVASPPAPPLPGQLSPERLLAPPLAAWFAARGWAPYPHQLEMLGKAAAGRTATGKNRGGQSVLLVAPTGGGKTLAGFLPSLNDLALRDRSAPADGFHTLYISPLKALTVDIARNLEAPIREMELGIRCEVRTGDTPQNRRQRQRRQPPEIMLTTPESLALLLSYAEAPKLFGKLRAIIIDELHAIADTKRGQLLSLGLARLARLAPHAGFIGLSATIPDPKEMAKYLSFRRNKVAIVRGLPGARPDISILLAERRVPWGGHMAQHAIGDIYRAVAAHGTTLVFVNTRAQAELIFQGLWRQNEENLPIALHHGSLSVDQRRKIEAAMAAGSLRAVVCTSSLDLGIDWGNVDLVIQVGAPKGSSRLLQRIGRANHRLDEPSRAILVPANRFELLECQAAMEAALAGELDGYPARPHCLDVLAQHILGTACSQPLWPDQLFGEITASYPYRQLSRQEFDDVFAYVAHGGYALRAYDRYHRLTQQQDGSYQIAAPVVARQYRMNVGTIVEAPMLRVKMRRGQVLGEVEEWFVQGLTPGDTFIFAGRLLRFEGIRAMAVECTAARQGDPKVPAYAGGRLPLTTGLAARVRALLADAGHHQSLPRDIREWLRLQRQQSRLPGAQGVVIESFPRGSREFLVAYCFEGRNAHQTLGMLLTRRMEKMGLKPLGFVASDYVLGIWGLRAPDKAQLEQLLAPDMLGDDLEEWLEESSMLRRSFRNVAVIAGLIERRHPGAEKSRKQVTFNADLIYDVLRKHEPGHILLRATHQDAAWNLADVGRLSDFLARIAGKVIFRRLSHVSPLAVPILLDIGRERIEGEAIDELLDAAARDLIAEATEGEGS
ncbi:MAG TPA: ligase-associated DNA damage response DEXH box helicase [Dongiaceae bacterium]|nr:ligase-associated DNA damage response DEXH box helicase [Dongiaceae bacterium]